MSTLVRCLGVCYVVGLCCNGVAQESSRVPLCNGEKTVSKSDDSAEKRGCDVNSQATPAANDAASSSDVNVNERLLGDGLPSTDTSLSRSSLNDSSLPSSEATSLPQLASEDVGHSVVAQP